MLCAHDDPGSFWTAGVYVGPKLLAGGLLMGCGVEHENGSEASEQEDYYWSALLARISSDPDVKKLRQTEILQNPSPVEFLGGLEFVGPGQTAYTKLDLKPGRYAWVLHGHQDSVRTFTVE